MRYTAEALTKLRAPSSAGGIIACGDRRSHQANQARRKPPVTRGAATSHDPHGWDADSVSPRVTATRPSALAATPGTSRRRESSGLRDSRTAVIVTAMAATAKGRLTQKTDAHPKKVSSTPPTTGPTPKPVPP